MDAIYVRRLSELTHPTKPQVLVQKPPASSLKGHSESSGPTAVEPGAAVPTAFEDQHFRGKLATEPLAEELQSSLLDLEAEAYLHG